MKNNKSESSGRHYSLVIVICVLIIIVAILLYRYHIGGYFSSSSKDWGDFGNYFASITGLLAFIGVIWTLHTSLRISKETNERFLESEERDVFFRSLDIFQQNRSLICYNDKKGIQAITDHKLLFYDVMYAYIFFCLLFSDYYLNIIDEISKVYPDFEKNITSIKNKLNSYKKELKKKYNLDLFETESQFKFIVNMGIIDDYVFIRISYLAFYIEEHRAEDDFRNSAFNYIQYLGTKGETQKLFEIYSNSLSYFVRLRGEGLIPYFKNVHYILKQIYEFRHTSEETKKNYMSILRAQLSNNEVFLLYLNNLGKDTSLYNMYLYKNAELLQSIDPVDLKLQNIDKLGDYSFIDITKEIENKNWAFLKNCGNYGTSNTCLINFLSKVTDIDACRKTNFDS